MRKMCTAALVSFLLVVAAAAQDTSKNPIKTTKLTENLYVLEGERVGGNIAVLNGPDGLLVVDAGVSQASAVLVKSIQTISDKPVHFLLNTHFHRDHIGSNSAVGAGATIVAHRSVRQRMMKKATVLGQSVGPYPAAAWPNMTFDDSLALYLNGEEIRLIHHPSAHTDGDCIVWFTKAKVVHMGDELFAGTFPFIDLDNGGDVRGYIKAVDDTLDMVPPDTRFIAGHGPTYSVAELKAWSNMLKEVTGIVQKAVDHGKTLEQVQNEKLLAAYDRYAPDFMPTPKFTEIVYKSLSRK